MILALSHNSAKPCGGDVVASVKMSHPVRSVGFVFASGRSDPRNAGLPPVEGVDRGGDVTQIADSVISRVSVDMVNDLWHFVMGKPPGKPMAAVLDSLVCDSYIARGMKVASFITSFVLAPFVRPHFPRQIARARIVIQDIADRIRDNYSVHCVPFYVMDRGVRTAILVPHFTHMRADGTTPRARWYLWLRTPSTLVEYFGKTLSSALRALLQAPLTQRLTPLTSQTARFQRTHQRCRTPLNRLIPCQAQTAHADVSLMCGFKA